MRAARGFTLIEVLVALTLLSMLSVATIAAMRTLATTQGTLEDITSRIDDVRSVSEFLRASIKGSVAAPMANSVEQLLAQSGGDEPLIGTLFVGGAGELVWVAPLLGAGGHGGTFLHRLRLVGDELRLGWLSYDYLLMEGVTEPEREKVLLRSVESFELGYRAAYMGDWADQWTGETGLPVTVRMRIKAEGRFWPELVVDVPGSLGQTL
jgi:general secretion pathway protein J